MEAQLSYPEATVATANQLKTIAHSALVRDLSKLTLPEIDRVIESIAQIIPAGNVPGVILSGLARLPGRRPPAEIVNRDINLLFSSIDRFMDKAIYGATFAGPAAVIWGYQNLLKLAGKDLEDAFPQGIWQYYLDYALRDDTARHSNETEGFDTTLNHYHIYLNPADRLTAWIMAVIHCLHQYNEFLANEWREHTCISLLGELTVGLKESINANQLFREWEANRPFARSATYVNFTFPEYRKLVFDQFLEQATTNLPQQLRTRWQEQIYALEAKELGAYQEQMSILAHLMPGRYGETHRQITLNQAQVAIIRRGFYYLIPICGQESTRPSDVSTVRSQVAQLFSEPNSTVNIDTTSLLPLTQVSRTALIGIILGLDPQSFAELEALSVAPIIINSDLQPRWIWGPDGKRQLIPLSHIRQAERGMGSHPLTIFDTGETFIFDQSHIFFDGALGSAFAEIMTNEALSWAVYLHDTPRQQLDISLPRHLSFHFSAAVLEAIEKCPKVAIEVGAENEGIDLKAISRLRKLIRQRNESIRLTVNDLLVLYRAIHAATYQPDPNLVQELIRLSKNERTGKAARIALESVNCETKILPSILIPIDASLHSVRDRLYPMSFEVPLYDLDLLNLHNITMQSLAAYQSLSGDPAKAYEEFNCNQRLYLGTLAGFGLVMRRAKDIAMHGEAASIGTIKMLAYLPVPLQRLLESIPTRIDMLNAIIKGNEVFSNVGSVASSSSLTRFITAIDDDTKKMLAWGVITTGSGKMRISMRDFRPHVAPLVEIGCRETAVRIAEDYLNAYALNFNKYIADLQLITLASRDVKQPSMEARG